MIVNRKRVLTLVVWILISTLVLSVSGCGGQPAPKKAEPAPAPAKPKVLTYTHSTDIEGLGPHTQSGAPGLDAIGNMYEDLVKIDWGATPIKTAPNLAESWEIKDAGKLWVFRLRQGVKFHDGTEFTSADVIHSFTRIRDDKDSDAPQQLQDVVEMQAIDKYTVGFKLSQPRNDLDYQFNEAYIGCKATFDKYGTGAEADKHPNGTGPYKFKQWEKGSFLAMTRNDNYWNKNLKLDFDEIVYQPIPEKATAIAALETGKLDIVDAIPPHEVARLDAKSDIRIESVPSGRLMFLVLNPGYKPFNDVRVRQAVHYAVDVDTIIATLLEGRAKREKQMIPQGTFGYNPNIKPYEYNPEKAKQLLAQAGYSKGVDIEFWATKGRFVADLAVCEAIAKQLQAVGFRVKLQVPEYSVYRPKMEAGELPMYLTGRGQSVINPQWWLPAYFQTGQARMKYSNSKVDQGLNGARVEMDNSKREKIIQDTIALIMADAVAMPMYRADDVYAVRETLDWKPNASERIKPAYSVRLKPAASK